MDLPEDVLNTIAEGLPGTRVEADTAKTGEPVLYLVADDPGTPGFPAEFHAMTPANRKIKGTRLLTVIEHHDGTLSVTHHGADGMNDTTWRRIGPQLDVNVAPATDGMTVRELFKHYPHFNTVEEINAELELQKQDSAIDTPARLKTLCDDLLSDKPSTRYDAALHSQKILERAKRNALRLKLEK